MSASERLIELLERWEELQRQGQEISARELCAGAPELEREVEQAIGKLKKADSHLNLDTPSSAPPSPAEQSSAGRSSPWPWGSKGSSVPAKTGTTRAQERAR